jgi:hypothetical protein
MQAAVEIKEMPMMRVSETRMNLENFLVDFIPKILLRPESVVASVPCSALWKKS